MMRASPSELCVELLAVCKQIGQVEDFVVLTRLFRQANGLFARLNQFMQVPDADA